MGNQLETIPSLITADPEPSLRETIKIIRREEIPTLKTVVVDNVEQNLGILKDFRKHPDLLKFLPDEGRMSLAWVSLKPSEVLESHIHPIKTMIIMCHGKGRIQGDIEGEFSDGDIVIIPSGCLHGFVGAGDDGFWGLSIQFEGRGIYENPSEAQVTFAGDRLQVKQAKKGNPGLEKLLQRNKQFTEDHKKNPMFDLVTSGRLAEERLRNRFFDCVQVWSNFFQKTILTRSAFTEDRQFAQLFKKHLDEEYGHNTNLAAERGDAVQIVWDPILEATSNWFAWKMLTLDNTEKTVLVHLVLEVGSSAFSTIANPIMAAFQDTEYFAIHDEADEDHQEMGLDLLIDLEQKTYDRLMQIQKEGWDMLNVLCARIAELVESY
ncbi:MAG: hypothetical protein KME08_07580 [Aphanothece sp. CMT-3BRIN-NPC111]|jgi:quercetin dioxygenase-like cupin family protein|nr:hypothetical protein [Aphanothece sp. CMT-3BRIN-NPC111]